DFRARQEARAAAPADDAVALELVPEVALVALAHGLEPAHQAGDLRLRGNGDVDHALAARAQAHGLAGALAQRLARDRSALHALAAGGGIAVDDEHALPGLGRLDGGFVSGGAGS